jgi:hypothetical protein
MYMNTDAPFAQLLYQEIRWPLVLTLLVVLGAGWYLLDRAADQARDTIRKHHLDDLEHALYFARGLHGTYPPYDQPSWCGKLDDPTNSSVREEIETALRAQHEKYANPAKPFPTDPIANTEKGYFYWKRSPASFEFYAQLEQDPTQERSTTACPNAPSLKYDYGIASVWREDYR